LTTEEKAIINRLRRLEGQIRGIERMITDNRSCKQIIPQISAIQAGIKKVGQLILKETAEKCFADFTKSTDKADLDELISFFSGYLSEVCTGEEDFEQ